MWDFHVGVLMHAHPRTCVPTHIQAYIHVHSSIHTKKNRGDGGGVTMHTQNKMATPFLEHGLFIASLSS